MEKTILALLTITVIFGAFSVWSAFNPSYFTIRKFGETDTDWQLITTGIILAIVVIVVISWASFRIVEAM
jgi:uncharacterized Tic20 family protein